MVEVEANATDHEVESPLKTQMQPFSANCEHFNQAD